MLTDHTIDVKLALEILQTQGFLWTKVTANNSKPLIIEGDMICLKACNGPFKPGDLIATDSLKMFIVQRILQMNGDQYLTKADMSLKGPFSCTRDKIIAKVALIKHKDQYIDIDNPWSGRLNRIISHLSYKRTSEFDNTSFRYRPFFQRLRRSVMKRLLKFEKITCTTHEKKIRPELQIN
ncbi:MAG: hypothetical protein JXA23_00420 [Bacteroidales bacterium]|nr:hypothetical protein [Bacteroidales bacterium]